MIIKKLKVSLITEKRGIRTNNEINIPNKTRRKFCGLDK